MEIVDLAASIAPDKRNAVVALGTFDGMHLEDQRVIAKACEIGRATGSVSSALLFEPHPRRLLHPEQPPFSLMNTDQRRRSMERLGLERIYLGLFSPHLVALSATGFVEHMMRDVLGAAYVCASSRIQFGRSDAERAAFLQALRTAYGDRFAEVAPQQDAKGEYIASADIRRALQEGDLPSAEILLGRPYAIEGPVVHGAKLGRTIGFPTLNIPLGEYLRPLLGIYASRSRLMDGRRLPGVSYIGRRPTVGGVEELLETFLFDFNESIYGQSVETELVRLLRPDQTFGGMEEMRQQIAKDCEQARRILA
jgi:riboflavin kinase/FMN adenylyltransferase